MILEILSVGLIVSAVLALFLDEVVYAVAALSGTFLFTALIYALSGSIYAAIFQFAVGVGTLAILFLSGEMLGEKTTKKASPTKVGGLIGAGVVFSLPAIFLSVSSTPEVSTGLQVGDALWNLRGVDVLIQGVVILTVALGIAIVLFERRKK
jgi:NADH:ubiquinone oxidoreductase subunit 6 (subunit J)